MTGRAVLATCVLLALLSGTASADPGDTVEQRIPFLAIQTNTCITPPETFQGTGFFHVKTHTSLGADGRLHVSNEFNVESVQAVALVSGKRYVMTAETSDSSNTDTTDLAPREGTFEDHLLFIRQGEDGTLINGDDLYQKGFAHFTVNANGVTTVDRGPEFTFECR